MPEFRDLADDLREGGLLHQFAGAPQLAAVAEKMDADEEQRGEGEQEHEQNQGIPEPLRQVVARADRLLERVKTMTGPVALFSHAQFSCVLAARWVGLAGSAGEHLVLDPASLSILGSRPGHPEVPVIARWNVVPAARLAAGSPD